MKSNNFRYQFRIFIYIRVSMRNSSTEIFLAEICFYYLSLFGQILFCKLKMRLNLLMTKQEVSVSR
jgi:hypothetical protein